MEIDDMTNKCLDFFMMDKVERAGMGIQQMKEAMIRTGLKEPAFETDGFFRTVFFRPRKEDIFPQVTAEKIIEIIKENPKITTAELALRTGLTVKGIEWNIRELKEKGVLKRVGPDKGGYWEVIK